MDWTPQEKAVIVEIAAVYDISETDVLRCALRHYQIYYVRESAGEKCVWSGDVQRARDRYEGSGSC